MSQIEQKTFDATPQGVQANFPEIVKIEPCSANECENGHKWPPQFALTGCPGCGAPILMIRMVNCPVCNQPTSKIRFRSDHAASGMGVAALCRQQKGLAESTQIEMIRHASEETMQKWDEKTGRMEL